MTSPPRHTHLFTLAMVVDKRSYTRAAEILGITQPSVSQQMRDLERACGGQLLVMQGRSLVPTALGEQLFNRQRVAKSNGARGKERRRPCIG